MHVVTICFSLESKMYFVLKINLNDLSPTLELILK